MKKYSFLNLERKITSLMKYRKVVSGIHRAGFRHVEAPGQPSVVEDHPTLVIAVLGEGSKGRGCPPPVLNFFE